MSLRSSHGSDSSPGFAPGAERPAFHTEGSRIGCSTLTLLTPHTYLFRPDLDPLPPLLPGFAPGTLGLPIHDVLAILGLLVQVLHQLLDSVVSGRGTDFPLLLGGEPGGAAERFSVGEKWEDRGGFV